VRSRYHFSSENSAQGTVSKAKTGLFPFFVLLETVQVPSSPFYTPLLTVCSPYFDSYACFLDLSIAERWAIEFDGTREEAEDKASQFALAQGLDYHGRIGVLNAFEFSFPGHSESAKRDALALTRTMLQSISSESEGKEPKHPITELQEIYEQTRRAYLMKESSSKKGAHSSLADEFGILWAQEQVPKAYEKRDSAIAFSDPLYPQQYHLHRVTPTTATLNVTGAWDSGINGNGVTIAIVDDGLQHIHPDISPNYHPEGSYNFDFNRADPSPNSMTADYHGTSSAGVAASRDDGTACGVGVAYRAGLSGIAILQNDALDDIKESRALQYALSVNHIYSNSWGPPDGGNGFAAPGTLTKQAISLGVRSGRNGKGAIYVWAGGNGGSRDNCNYDGYASSRLVVTVGAVDSTGHKSSFSEECAALLVVAPSASNPQSYIRTTDLLGSYGRAGGDCNLAFSGTSAACPAIAGVVALILQANPSLSWLDVQRVLIETAIKNDPSSTSWQQNGAGFWHSHSYGFGLADASAAVQRAKTLLQTELSMDREISLNYEIPKAIPWTNTPSGPGTIVRIPVVEKVVIHHVELFIDDLRTADSGRLDVVLTSPMGTKSVLAVQHQRNAPNLRKWTFTSRRLWGETSDGNWVLSIGDSNLQGSLNSFTLRIWATPTAEISTSIFRVLEGDVFTPDWAPVRLIEEPVHDNNPAPSERPVASGIGPCIPANFVLTVLSLSLSHILFM
jgi:subtilisin family serine protease